MAVIANVNGPLCTGRFSGCKALPYFEAIAPYSVSRFDFGQTLERRVRTKVLGKIAFRSKRSLL
jgi:hypothetical protein